MTTEVRCKRVTSDTLIDFLRWAIDRACEDTELVGSAQRVQLRGMQMDVLTRNDHYAEMVGERLFAGDSGSDTSEQFRVAVLSPDDSSLPLPPAWGEAVYHPRNFEQQLEGTGFLATYFHDCNLWQIYDQQRRFGLQWMIGSRGYPDWEPGAPLRVFLHWACRQQDMRLAHAGTLGKGSEGMVLVGVGGSGKSGTVIGGIAHGLASVGDDYVLIDHAEDAVNAYPLFKTLKQDRAGLERLGLSAAISGTHKVNWQNKYEFDSTEISGGPLASQLRIRAIVIPRIARAERSSIRPIAKNRAMLALAPTGIFQMPGERDSGVRFFSEMVRRVPCFELALSSDPVNVSQTLEAFIDGDFQCD